MSTTIPLPPARENPALSAASAKVLRSTLPAVREHAVEITTEFYSSMFAAHPELLDVFNQGNQASGRQRLALASAVVRFAESLLDQSSSEFAPFCQRISHKHVSLGIRAEQYPLVGHYLLNAVRKVLGAAVTHEVVAAWQEAYWLLACQLIAAEARLYERSGVDSSGVWRRWRVTKRQDEAVDAVSFTFVPDDGGTVPDFLPGQYISLAVDLPGGRRQIRQYSLSQGPGRGALRVTVRRVRGTGNAPSGAVSTWLHERVDNDDVVLLGPPAGENTLVGGDDPVVLVSAGIGITPMVSMLDQIARSQPTREVVAAHADRSPQRHALRAEVAHLTGALRSFRQQTWYETGADGPARTGLLEVDAIPLPERATAYLCGPLPFMRHVRDGLLRRGLPAERIRYEVFGPGMLDEPAS
ncbi:nitric oxide dioxygenase [Kutzneria viridogrisea]|uniref:nitric oxide dioxygenase n=1 Tax=Kutzneria viridogrisea TaxID=47990 RepID=A0ABR6B971_9PSEU|nr:globin domain-containing protein [Kutzneria albida]MBA8923410.1 nitric oxide dioxygenase [Kutzneria viridogrisea]